jgi:hypothetical protein
MRTFISGKLGKKWFRSIEKNVNFFDLEVRELVFYGSKLGMQYVIYLPSKMN